MFRNSRASRKSAGGQSYQKQGIFSRQVRQARKDHAFARPQKNLVF
jgi:hypothetical protein